MSEFPTLTEMGISNPNQIQRFTYVTTNNTDHIRVIFQREKGSFLPASKRFEFGRSAKTVVTDSGTHKTQVVHEISPFVQKAISELESIVNAHSTQVEHAKVVKEELQRLHQEMSSRLTYIETLIDRI